MCATEKYRLKVIRLQIGKPDVTPNWNTSHVGGGDEALTLLPMTPAIVNRYVIFLSIIHPPLFIGNHPKQWEWNDRAEKYRCMPKRAPRKNDKMHFKIWWRSSKRKRSGFLCRLGAKCEYHKNAPTNEANISYNGQSQFWHPWEEVRSWLIENLED